MRILRYTIFAFALSLLSCLGKDSGEEFIRTMYDGRLYEDYEFLENNCSAGLLQRLSNEYDYDGGGYAVWLFRSGMQDGPTNESRILEIEQLGDGWYRYKALDMGHFFDKYIKLSLSGSEQKVEALADFPTVDAEEFERVCASGTVIRLDVRTPQEYMEGHLENAINIDVMGEGFAEKICSLDRGAKVAVYCRSGRRSRKAVEELVRAGFQGCELGGGILSWSAAAKPIVK